MANPILEHSVAISQYSTPQIIAWHLRDSLKYSKDHASQTTSEFPPLLSSSAVQSEQPYECIYTCGKSHWLVSIDQHGSTTQVDLNSTTSPCQSWGNNMSLQLWSFALTSYNFLRKQTISILSLVITKVKLINMVFFILISKLRNLLIPSVDSLYNGTATTT